jgi:hypothetical protein
LRQQKLPHRQQLLLDFLTMWRGLDQGVVDRWMLQLLKFCLGFLQLLASSLRYLEAIGSPGNLNSCLPDLELGALTKWLASLTLDWVSAFFRKKILWFVFK